MPHSDESRITQKSQLVQDIERGAKKRAQWRIGTEHEKFGFRMEDQSPLPYGGTRGIQAMLNGLNTHGWIPIKEDGIIVGLKCADTGGSITLEPGGQLELSGAPLQTVHQTCREVNKHLDDVQAVAEQLGIAFLGSGFSPKWTRAETPIMPKKRYDIMRRYMPTRGNYGLDMMFRTATVQVNLDFESEADMVEKFRVALALQPVATALFANSPFTEGKPNGFLSYRSHMWTDTDPDRCGMLPFVFEDGFGFERWVDYMLDVPMYLIHRDGQYHDVTGRSFRDFMDGQLDIFPNEYPKLSDWQDHLTTAFPEVRLKYFIEMRGADGGPWRRLCALPALWVGLLYDRVAQSDAWSLVKDWTIEEMQQLRTAVPRTALKTPFRTGTVQHIAKQVVQIARDGLNRRAHVNEVGANETMFLDALSQIAIEGVTPAERLLEAYHGHWNGDISKYFEEERY
jgi:glutamate--cysteine ligase